jgi:hypothetical protein
MVATSSMSKIRDAIRFIDGQTGNADVAHYFNQGANTQFVRLDDLPRPADLSDFVLEPGTILDRIRERLPWR